MPADDARSGGNAVIVLSHKGWDRHFNRDPNVLGRTVLVNGAPFEIIGVTAAGFRGLEVGGPDVWAPLSQLGQFRPADRGREDAAGVEIVGRLRPGVSKDKRSRATGRLGFQPIGGHPRPPLHEPRPAAAARYRPAAAGSHRGLRAALRRLRIDPDDRVRQRRQPVAGAGSGAAAGDRHSTLAWRIAAAHCPPADDRERAAGAGRGCGRLPDLAPRAGGRGVLGAADDAGRYRRRQPQRAGGRLASRGVSRGRRGGGDRILRADAGAARDGDRPGADAARGVGKRRAAGSGAQRADRRAGVRVGAAADLRGHLSAQRNRLCSIRSGFTHRRYGVDRHQQRAEARGDDPGSDERRDDHRIRCRQAAVARPVARCLCRQPAPARRRWRSKPFRDRTSMCSTSPSCAGARSCRGNATIIRWRSSPNPWRARCGPMAGAWARRSGSNRMPASRRPAGS